MQAERHELLLQRRQVMTDLVHEELVVDLREGDAADLELAGHARGELALEVQLRDELTHARDRARLPGVVPPGLRRLVALHELAQLEELVVERRRGERRGEVVDDDRLTPTLGLDALADSIDDVDVGVREIAEQALGVVVGVEPRTLSGKELGGAVPAHVNDHVRPPDVAHVVVPAEVLVVRREGQVRVEQLLVDLPAARRLRSEPHVAELEARDEHVALPGHHRARRLAPPAQPFDAGAAQGFGELAHRAPARGVAGEDRVVRSLQLARQIERPVARAVLHPFEQMPRVTERHLDPVTGEAHETRLERTTYQGAKAMQRPALDGLSQGLGERREVATVIVSGEHHASTVLRFEGAGVLGKVHARGLKTLEERLGALGHGARPVARTFEEAEHLEERRGHVEVVGSDVVTPRGMVVVDDGDALVGVGSRPKPVPAHQAGREPRELAGQRQRPHHAEPGPRVQLGRPVRRHHVRLALALQLGHGHLVVDFLPGHPVRGELPLRALTVGQAYGGDHRHVEGDEGLGRGLPAFAAADDEVLEHDDTGERGIAQGGGQARERLDRRLTPAREQGEAAELTLRQGRAERGVNRAVGAAVAGVVVEDGHDGAGGKRERFGRAELRVHHVADGCVPEGRRHSDAGCVSGRDPGQETGDVGAAPSLPVGAGFEPRGLTWMGAAQAAALGRAVRGRRELMGERAEGLFGDAREGRLAIDAGQRREPRIAREGQHRRALRRWRIDEKPFEPRRLLPVHAEQEHGVGPVPERHGLIIGELRELVGGAEQDRVIRTSVEKGMGARDGFGRRTVRHEANDTGRRRYGRRELEREEHGEQRQRVMPRGSPRRGRGRRQPHGLPASKTSGSGWGSRSPR